MSNNFACDIIALTPNQRSRHAELAKILRSEVIEIIELPNGYSAMLRSKLNKELAEFCELERRCCPFFNLEVIHNADTSKLSITGSGEIKPFIRAEFGIPSSV